MYNPSDNYYKMPRTGYEGSSGLATLASPEYETNSGLEAITSSEEPSNIIPLKRPLATNPNELEDYPLYCLVHNEHNGYYAHLAWILHYDKQVHHNYL